MADTRMSIVMDASGTEQVVEMIIDRVSGQSLYRYLEGPVHGFFKSQISMNFAGEGSPAGGRWMSLSSATQDIRSQLGYDPSHPVNQRTGDLFEVLTKEADFNFGGDNAEMSLPGKAGQAFPVREKIKTAQMGRSAEENPIPEFGGTPARPIFGITTFGAERILAGLSDWIMHDLAGTSSGMRI